MQNKLKTHNFHGFDTQFPLHFTREILVLFALLRPKRQLNKHIQSKKIAKKIKITFEAYNIIKENKKETNP